MAAITLLNCPMRNAQVAEFRKLSKNHQRTKSVTDLLAAIERMQSTFGAAS